MIEKMILFETIVRKSKGYGQTWKIENRDVHPFDERNIHSEITKVSIRLFDDGHYAQATFEAFKLIEGSVKTISGVSDTGFNLMMNVFNEKSAKIKLNNLNSMSDIDEQLGFRHIFAGVFSGIRNPRGHENKADSIDICLDHLSVASVLLRVLETRKAP
jgi:uncharacterized protein (TIGR02391 family)